MEESTRAPIIIFIFSLLLVSTASGISVWSIKQKESLSDQLKILNSQQVENFQQLSSLASEVLTPEVAYVQLKVGSYSEMICSDDGLVPKCTTKWHDIVTTVPTIKNVQPSSELQRKIALKNKAIEKANQEIKAVTTKLEKTDTPGGIQKDYMRILISIIVIGANLFVILSQRYKSQSEKWHLVASVQLWGIGLAKASNMALVRQQIVSSELTEVKC